jgi:hypothetical protein
VSEAYSDLGSVGGGRNLGEWWLLCRWRRLSEERNGSTHYLITPEPSQQVSAHYLELQSRAWWLYAGNMIGFRQTKPALDARYLAPS